uniref:Uncharacterized protein n=1 Tax=Arundo donax TaxID=35708 RepID=A0A0A9CW22_ARUDO
MFFGFPRIYMLRFKCYFICRPISLGNPVYLQCTFHCQSKYVFILPNVTKQCIMTKKSSRSYRVCLFDMDALARLILSCAS